MLLSILLLILKIVAFVLLGLLAVVLFLVLIILFVPFSYRVYAERKEKLYGSAAVSWLFGIIGLVFIKDNNDDAVMFFRVLGLKIKPKRKPPLNEENNNNEDIIATATVENPKKDVTPQPRASASASEPSSAQGPAMKEPLRRDDEKKGKKQKEKRLKKEKPPKNEPSNTFKEFWELENKREIISQVFLLIKRLMGIIFNFKLWAKLKFGTGQPDTTGYLLGLCFAASGFAGIKIDAEGDFEDKSLIGQAEIKGRIFICSVLWAIIIFIFNKHIFKLIKKYIFKKG